MLVTSCQCHLKLLAQQRKTMIKLSALSQLSVHMLTGFKMHTEAQDYYHLALVSCQLFLPSLDLSQTFLDLKSDKCYNILGYYSKVPIITELFKPNQNPVSGGYFPESSRIIYTIFIHSFAQSRRTSSGVCWRRNLKYSIFIVVSIKILWHLILYSCNQTSSFEMSQPCYFSQAKRKILWQQQQQQQQQQHKREPTTRVGPWTLFNISPSLAQDMLVSQSQLLIWLIIQQLKPTTRIQPHRLWNTGQHYCHVNDVAFSKNRIASWLWPSAFSGFALLHGCPPN